MGVGRFFCVALPFALTVGSIIFLLVGALAGVADKSLYLFRIDVTDLSINPANTSSIIENITSRDHRIDTRDNHVDTRDHHQVETRATQESNITASDLGLGKVYDIALWGYCWTDQKDKRHCTKAKFDWAKSALNTSYIEHFGSAAGREIDLPDELKNALKAFRYGAKWTEVAYIVAFIALAAEIVLGIFANCSRVMSCCTWIISGLAAALVIAAASLSSAMGLVVVAAIKASAKWYGVKGKINTTFFSAVWIAAAFALAASMFWIWTICCCAPERRPSSNRKNRRSDGEKLLPSTGYAPLGNDHEMTSGNYYNQNQSQSQYGASRSGGARSDLAYEPYSHRA